MNDVRVDYDADKNQFKIQCPYHMNDLVKAIPDRKWSKKERVWVAPGLKRNVLFLREWFADKTTPAAKRYLDNYEVKVVKHDTFPAWYPHKTTPMDHQKASINAAWGNTEYAFLLEQGLGKSKCVIDWFTALRMEGKINAVVVVVPTSIKLVWEKELAVHCPIDYQAMQAKSGQWKKIKQLYGQDFPWLIVGVEAFSQGSAFEFVKEFMLMHECAMAVDESSRIKNADTNRTERCCQLGEIAKYRAISTGTPVTQGAQDLYSQFNFLDPEILGFQSYYSFRNYFCIMGGHEDKKILGYHNLDELIETIAPFATRVTKDEAMDLPPKVYEKRYVSMNKEQDRLYKEMKQNMIAEMTEGEEQGKITVKSILEQMTRLQQIAGGFLPVADGFDAKGKPKYRSVRIPGKNPKIEEIMLMLPEMHKKVIIFARFKPEIYEISERCRKEGYKVVEYHGGIDDDDKVLSEAAFQDGDAEIFVATPQCASMGLTLTASHDTIYFSNSFSLEDRLQSEDRNHRRGTTNKVTYNDIFIPGTVDDRVEESVTFKKKLAHLVSESIKEGKLL